MRPRLCLVDGSDASAVLRQPGQSGYRGSTAEQVGSGASVRVKTPMAALYTLFVLTWSVE